MFLTQDILLSVRLYIIDSTDFGLKLEVLYLKHLIMADSNVRDV